MFCIIKAILAWIILLVIGQTLVGLVTRGFFWSPPSIDAPTDCVRELLEHESKRLSIANIAMTLLSLVLTAAFFFVLYYFWNVGLVVSAGLIMLSRLPDLLWEIQTGIKGMPKGVVYIVANLMLWLSLPLIWYSLCKWTP
jgi:hypothetical protein